MLGVTEILLLVAVVVLVIQYFKPKKNLPPGPPGLPLIGNLLQMQDDKPHVIMANWAKKYGKIYKMQVGSNLAVVVNDVKLIKEMLFDANFTNRPDLELNDLFAGGKYGIIFTNGHQWEEQRRWSLRKLRDYGLGKSSLEGIIMDEANYVVEYLKKNGEKPTTVNGRYDIAVLNSLWTIVTGARLEQDDPKIRNLLDTFNSIIPVIQKSGLIFAPWLKYIMPSVWRNVEKVANRVMSFCHEAVAEHYKTYKDGTIRDFIDEYIAEVKGTTDPESSFYQEKGKKNLQATISDLLQAGSFTTSNTLTWAMGYLSQNQEAQKKLRDELESVLGSRSVTLSDKPSLPYTEAVILETLRHSSLVATGVQHSADNDKEVAGYTIPKGAWILTNIYFVHHDEKIWGDPHNFRPERFLSPDGKKVVRHEALIAFQMGRRQCLGESLARDTLFLFMATLFQNFSVTMVENCEPEAEVGQILMSKPYHYVFKYKGN